MGWSPPSQAGLNSRGAHTRSYLAQPPASTTQLRVRERAEEVAENLVVVVVMRGVKDTVDGVLVSEALTPSNQAHHHRCLYALETAPVGKGSGRFHSTATLCEYMWARLASASARTNEPSSASPRARTSRLGSTARWLVGPTRATATRARIGGCHQLLWQERHRDLSP